MDIKKIKPMLAQPGKVEDLKRSGFIFEPKVDGTRAIVYVVNKSIRILNRKGEWIEYKYPELYNIWATIKANSCVLDAELVVFDKRTKKPSANLLAKRENQKTKMSIDVLSKKARATLIIFDILQLEGEDLTSKALHERKNLLDQTVFDSAWMKKIYWTQRGEDMLTAVKKQGMGGVIAKDSHSPYLAGERSDSWLKIKM